MSRDYSKRRMLMKCEGKLYKLLSFTQSPDGSIYIGFKNFPAIRWMGVELADNGLKIFLVDSAKEEGKLSVHATGLVGFRAHNAPANHQLAIRGNYLYDHKNETLGARHVISMYMEEPDEVSTATGFSARNSDYVLENKLALKPFVMILFAVPRVSNIESFGISSQFDMDDLDSMPPDGGMGLIELKLHSIAWFIYRTKYMDNWPRRSYICYHDGYHVPLYIGKSQNEASGELRFELHKPTYEFNDNKLTIQL